MVTYIKPHTILRNTVDYYWMEKHSQTTCKMLPDASTSIVFNFGNPIVVQINNMRKLLKGHFLYGAQSGYSIVSFENSVIVGIKFKQGGATNLIKDSMHKYKNSVVSLTDTPASKIAFLADKITGFLDEKLIKKIFDYYLLLNVDMLEGASETFSIACKLIKQTDIKTITQICEHCSCSNKHLITLFNSRVGLSPGLVLRINKFVNVLDAIHNKKFITWPQLALDCNYYDQAHLINEFKRFSGITPVKYLNENNTKGLRVFS